ncbi:hypothetical protein [Actinomadura sp. DC4]|uniref:WXG100-like domain-containing protein n=1 Tax=Actinomadura sp. DC4 TaxID=3055069 RepID=UPI0025AF1024|nr:hypothetical protein [Actinomadura sp. DC4]MDN3355928.1 hypothetical protein [Actinomadura sp. DC4]
MSTSSEPWDIAVDPQQIVLSARKINDASEMLRASLVEIVGVLGLAGNRPWGNDELGRSFFEGQNGSLGFRQARDELLGGLAELARSLDDHASKSARMAQVYADADHASQVNPGFPGALDAVSTAKRGTALRDVVGGSAAGWLPQEDPPPDHQWLLELLETMVAGCTYPAGDARQLDQMSGHFNTLADAIDEVTHVTTRQGSAIREANSSSAIDLFTKSFAQLAGGGGHLSDAALACRGVGAYCRYTSVQIRWAKTNFAAGCAYLTLFWAIARSVPTLLPAGTLAALAETGRVGALLRVMLTSVGFRVAASGAAFMGGLALVSDFTRKAYGLPADWESVLTSTVFGAVSGGVAGKIHLSLGKAAADGSGLAGFLAHRVPGQLAVNTGIGFGLNVAGDDILHDGDINWSKDLSMAAGMAGVMALGRVFGSPADSSPVLALSREAFGVVTAVEMTDLAGTRATSRLEDMVQVLVDENQGSGLPAPQALHEWTRNALALPADVPVTAHHVDALARVVGFYKEDHPGETLPPGVRALHEFAATSAPGRSGGDAVQELGRLLRLHESWSPGEPFDYWRHTGELVRLRQLTTSVLELGPDTEVSARHVETVLRTLFGERQTDVTSAVADPRRADLTILLKSLDADPRTRAEPVTLGTVHDVIRRRWDVPPDQVPTPADARALVRLWATVPGTTESGIARDLLGLDRPPTTEEVKAAGHALSLAIDLTRGMDWPQVARYFTPTLRLQELVRSEYGIPPGEVLSPARFHEYARDLFAEHDVWSSHQHVSRTLMDAALISDFYGLDKEAANPVEQRFMLGEIARLSELVKHEWPRPPGLGDSATVRIFEPVAERLTGSPDPYELLKLYRRVKFDAPDGLVHSIRELARSEHAAKDAFTDWDKFDVYEYTRRNYEGERVPARWAPPAGAVPGRWEPGRWEPRIIGHDLTLIDAIYSVLKNEYGVAPGDLHRVLDVGSGTNPYPPAVFEALLSDDGYVEKLVYEANAQEIAFNKAKYGPGDGIYRNTNRFGIPQELDTRKLAEPWGKVIAEAGAKHFPGQAERFERAVDRDLETTRPRTGDIFTFTGSGYDVGMEFYAADSMSTRWDVAVEFRDRVIRAVRPGGYVVFGNVLNRPAVRGGEAGQGYTAGDGTLFPNIAYYRERWESFLDEHPLVESYHIIESRDEDTGAQQFSAGEDGIGLIIIRLRDAPPG